jgi:hypothetical protein
LENAMMKIVIRVEGGVVQEVLSSSFAIDVEVFDVDTLKEEGAEDIEELWSEKEDEYCNIVY